MFFERIFKCPYCGELISNRIACRDCALVLEQLVNFKKLKTKHCNELIAPFVYDGLVRDAILKYKFGGKLDSCESFAFFMNSCDFKKVDFVVCVPSFQNREKFKLIKNLALSFAKAARLKRSFAVVKKIKQTKLQHECGLEQRLINLDGAFEAKKNRVKNKSILICDDIITSGSTVDELAKTLKKAGAVKVSAISIAISKIILKHGLAKLL